MGMKNAALILNAVLLVAVAVLFYLFFSSKNGTTVARQGNPQQLQASAAADHPLRIAYFDLDSLENDFLLFNDVKDEINQKNEANTREKMKMRQMYQDKVNSYSKKGELSQQESETANTELRGMQEQMSNRAQMLDQDLQDFSMRKQKELRTKIEDFLKDYNKDKGYSFVFSNEPNLIFYRDTVYNITGDLVKGLNAAYNAKKK